MTEDETESLLSLPYVQYVKTEKKAGISGTTINKKDKTYPGYNIYTSNDDKNELFVKLIDMDDSLIHQWSGNPKGGVSKWKQVTPFPNGSIFLTSQRTPLDWQRVDATSRSLATYDFPGYQAHHASYCLEGGEALSIVRNKTSIPFQDHTFNAWDDSLVHLSSQGKILQRISLHKILKENPDYQKRLKYIYEWLLKDSAKNPFNKTVDIFHANNIDNLEWDIPGIAKKGSWLVTLRHLHKIIIVDPIQEKIIWQWGENDISGPHHATFLSADQILIFDNGVQKKASRIIVLDIRSKKIVWQYGQKPGQEFYTGTGGSAQRLPNGNTLISECNAGRVFEVTSSGEIVWEWYADFFTEGRHKRKRRTIYRMQRLPYDFFKNIKFNNGKISLPSKLVEHE